MGDARALLIRPLLLHRIRVAVAAAEGRLRAVADVADLAVVGIVPGERLTEHGRQADLGIGDGLDELVRRHRGLIGELRRIAAPTIAARARAHVGQDTVEDLDAVAPERAVIGAEAARDAGAAAAGVD